MTVPINAVLKNLQSLPVFPKTAAIMLVQLAKPSCDLYELHEMIIASPPLTALVLHLAYTHSELQESDSMLGVSEALMLIDLTQLKDRIESTLTQYTAAIGYEAQLESLWQLSLHTAKIARGLSEMTHFSPRIAYQCGLLLYLGEAFLLLNLQAEMGNIDKLAPMIGLQRYKQEEKVLGYSAVDVSSQAIMMLNLPTAMQTIIAHIQAPEKNEDSPEMSAILHLADWRARVQGLRLSDAQIADTFPSAIAHILGLDLDTILRQDSINWGLPQPVNLRSRSR